MCDNHTDDGLTDPDADAGAKTSREICTAGLPLLNSDGFLNRNALRHALDRLHLGTIASRAWWTLLWVEDQFADLAAVAAKSEPTAPGVCNPAAEYPQSLCTGGLPLCNSDGSVNTEALQHAVSHLVFDDVVEPSWWAGLWANDEFADLAAAVTTSAGRKQSGS